MSCRSTSLAWHAANVLQFFTGSEDASQLRKYNQHASRFLTDDRWIGAYGAIAMPQIGRCVELLKQSPFTRRAIVSMGELGEQDLNHPACWTSLHFLQGPSGLDLLIYQRSLYLHGVAPYDLSLLCNILVYVAEASGIEVGRLRWFVGSLHNVLGDECDNLHRNPRNLILPYDALKSPNYCLAALDQPGVLPDPYCDWLANKERT